MFWLAFDQKHNVLLAHFNSMLVSEDIRDLDEAVRRFVRDHGYVRGLLDFTDVSMIAIPHSFLVSRSRLPLISTGGQRVFVTPRQEMLDLALRYAEQQRDFGNPPPAVVRSLSEAYEILGIDTPRFIAVA